MIKVISISKGNLDFQNKRTYQTSPNIVVGGSFIHLGFRQASGNIKSSMFGDEQEFNDTPSVYTVSEIDEKIKVVQSELENLKVKLMEAQNYVKYIEQINDQIGKIPQVILSDNSFKEQLKKEILEEIKQELDK